MPHPPHCTHKNTSFVLECFRTFLFTSVYYNACKHGRRCPFMSVHSCTTCTRGVQTSPWLVARPSSASEPAACSGNAVSSLLPWEPGSMRPVVRALRSRPSGASGSWRGARRSCSPSLILWQWRETGWRSLLLAPSRLTPLECEDLCVVQVGVANQQASKYLLTG